MNDEIDTIEESFDTIPPEVQRYMYGPEFDTKLSELFSVVAITKEKQGQFKGALFGFIAQIEDEDDLIGAINDAVADEPSRQKIKDWLQTNVYQKVLELITVGYASADDDDQLSENSTPATTTPTSLASLADRLKQASIAAPAKRDDLNKEDADSAATTPKPVIDPYHEAIDG